MQGFPLAVILLGGSAALGWHTFGGNRIEAAAVNPPRAVVEMQTGFVVVAQGVKPRGQHPEPQTLQGRSMPTIEDLPSEVKEERVTFGPTG